MKKCCILLLFFCPLKLVAQVWQTFDTVFLNTLSKDFFARNKSIENVYCYQYDSSGINFISVHFKTIDSRNLTSNSSLSYDLHFDGDVYFFAKKYGELIVPKNVMTAVTKKAIDSRYQLSMTVSDDSVKLRLQYNYSDTGKDDEKIFTHIPRTSRYKYGISHLERLVSEALDERFFALGNTTDDSACLLNVIVDNRDSCLHKVELVEGGASLFTQIIADELKAAGGWEPSWEGGRPVKSYRKLFVRLNKNRSLEMGFNFNQ